MSDYPACAANLRHLRESARLSVDDVAAVIGLNSEWIWDLETYDEELYSTISLAALQRLAILFRTGASDLLLSRPGAGTRVPFRAFVTYLEERLRASGQSIDAFGDDVGWDLRLTLVEPTDIWSWSPEQLRDVAEGLRVDWVAALPAAGDAPPPLEGGGPILR